MSKSHDNTLEWQSLPASHGQRPWFHEVMTNDNEPPGGSVVAAQCAEAPADGRPSFGGSLAAAVLPAN